MRRVVPVIVAACLVAAGAVDTWPASAVASGAASIHVASAVVLRSKSGSVTISTTPFHLTFRNRSGRIVLAEDDAQPGPTAYASESPSPLGSTTGQRPPLDAPLNFLVGSATHATYPGSPWEGNELAGASSGVEFSARNVTALRRVRRGVVLTVATDDPAIADITVTVKRSGPVFDVDAHLVGKASAVLGDAYTSPGKEAFHGFGGNHDGVNHRGQTFDTWVQEENFGAGPAQPAVGGTPGTGGSHYLFPNGPDAGYYVQPQFISSRGYGFLLRQPQLSQWRLDSDHQHVWSVRVAGKSLRYAVAPGNAPKAIRSLTAITGRQRVPPRWGLGPQLDRLIYLGTSKSTYYAEVLSDLRHIKRDHLPLTGYRIEGWADLTHAQLEHVIHRLHDMGIHALLYFRAYASDDGAGTEQPDVFKTALTHGYFATTAGGAPYLFSAPFGAPGGVIDFTNPAAVKWFTHRIDAGLKLGADGFMADFGEQVQPTMHFADGQTGATMHNEYPVLYQRVVRHAVNGFERRHPRRHIYYYNRAGYSGSAKYESANFPGDETTDWSKSSGLASLAPDMLNRGVGGAFGYTTDIGGYEDATTGPTTKQLFLRWTEWAALSPLFRDHGSAEAGTHTPWSYDKQTLRTYIRLSRLHQRAEPLIEHLWRHASRTGIPITRPLWLVEPGNRHAAKQSEEWMLGHDLLVAPIVREGATSRRVFLPRGCWIDAGVRHQGNRSIKVTASLLSLPRFRRCGTRPLGR